MSGADELQGRSLRLRIGVEALPAGAEDDASLGRALLGRVEAALDRGLPPPAAVAVLRGQLWWYDLAPAVHERHDLHRLVSAIAGQEGVAAVGMVGVFRVRRGPRELPQGAVAFLEWPDCRWWAGLRPLDQGRPRQDLPALERSAEEGYPRPGGLGGWWSRSRREGLRLQARPDSQPTVH